MLEIIFKELDFKSQIISRRVSTKFKVVLDHLFKPERLHNLSLLPFADVIYLAEGDIVRHRHELENASEEQPTAPRHG